MVWAKNNRELTVELQIAFQRNVLDTNPNHTLVMIKVFFVRIMTKGLSIRTTGV